MIRDGYLRIWSRSEGALVLFGSGTSKYVGAHVYTVDTGREGEAWRSQPRKVGRTGESANIDGSRKNFKSHPSRYLRCVSGSQRRFSADRAFKYSTNIDVFPLIFDFQTPTITSFVPIVAPNANVFPYESPISFYLFIFYFSCNLLYVFPVSITTYLSILKSSLNYWSNREKLPRIINTNVSIYRTERAK